MWEVVCLDLKTGKRFSKFFYNYRLRKQFEKKCEFSKKIKITAIINF